MKPTLPRSPMGALLVTLLALCLLAAGCGDDDPATGAETSAAETGDESADADADGSDDADDESGDEPDDDGADDGADAPAADVTFPVDIDTASGTVTVAEQPGSIVSLSPTATEMLFAIGAGDQVVAVDLFSNYPPEAPEGTLDGFSPDLEAILAAGPDLVVTQGLPADVEAALVETGVVVLNQPTASSLDDIHDQIGELGLATGRIDAAADLNADIRADIGDVLASLPVPETPVRVFHEIDDSFYTASSASFIGQVYAEMGFENIADPLDDGSGFPLIDGESIIAADPTLIVFTDQAPYGADDIAARPGWDSITAVADGNIVQVDADVASRWGPRVVEFMQALAAAVSVGA